MPDTSPDFSFGALRRRPDVEAANLYAADAADRLILDEAAVALAAASAPGDVVVIGDAYGALTLGAAALHGARGIRTHQDAVTGERALALNAGEIGLADAYRSLPLGPELLDSARVVLLRLPRSLVALEEIATLIASNAAPDVTVFAGGMLKHMTRAMNDTLGAHFAHVQAGLARQKARVLTATGPTGAQAAGPLDAGAREFHDDLGLWICAHGGAFAGTGVDIGTRFLLGFLGEAAPQAASAVDLGCGTGALAAALAIARPGIRVVATDQSAAAVASAAETMAANRVADRVRVLRDDAGSTLPNASADLVVLNPPFHIGASVHAGAGLALIEAAGRLMAPGGELWTVFNSHLGYQSALRHAVGPTRQAGRNAKFTVTVSVRQEQRP